MTVIKKSLLGIAWLFTVSSLPAQVVTDGTLGAPVNLPGPNFQISPNLGQQRGGNLFHSFSQFNINRDQTATFTGPESVTNILARVTGGQSSFINGTLRSEIPNANLYLLNSNGILFGEHARLDISGSFHASTGDYVGFADGGRFYTSVNNQSVLTVAPPSAFGFLNNQAAPISIQGSFLRTREGKDLSLHGGDISMEQEAVLLAPGGKINLTSELGRISLSHSYVDVSADESDGKIGGNLTIHAPIFAMDNSLLVVNSWYGKGGNISISTDRFALSTNNVIVGFAGSQPSVVPFETVERQTFCGITASPGFPRSSSSLSPSRCAASSKENQSSFIITASDLPQETPYEPQTHWVLPRRR